MDVTKICDLLKVHSDILPSKARTYAKSLCKGATPIEKQSKLVVGILHDCLLSHKRNQNVIILEIISCCIEKWISNWDVFVPPSTAKLDVVLYELLKSYEVCEDTLGDLRKLTNSFLQLIRLPNGCSQQAAEWFSLRLLQHDNSTFTCGCNDSTDCRLFSLFQLQLQAIEVRYISGRFTQSESMHKTMDVVYNNVCHASACDRHIAKIADEFSVFLTDRVLETRRKSNVVDDFLGSVKNIILLHLTPDADVCSPSMKFEARVSKVASALKSLAAQNKNGHCSEVKAFAPALRRSFSFLVSKLSKSRDEMRTCFGVIAKCVNFFLLLTETKNAAQISQIFALYGCATKDGDLNMLSIVLKEYNRLLQDHSSVLNFGEEIEDTAVYSIFERTLSLCLKVTDFEICDRVDDVTTACVNMLKSFCGASSDPPLEGLTVTCYVKTVTVLVRALKITKNYPVAMETIESAVCRVSITHAKSLIKDWVKLKITALQVADACDVGEMKKRTLATNLASGITQDFLREVLLAELEYYDMLKNYQVSQLAAIDALLTHCNITHALKSTLVRKRLKLTFEWQLSANGVDFVKHLKSAQLICKPDADTWENFIQVELVSFLLWWNKGMEAKDSGCGVRLLSLRRMVDCCKTAAANHFPVSQEKITCDVIHEVSSVLCLFHETELSTCILQALINLIQTLPRTQDGRVSRLRIWNSSLAHSKIAANFLEQKQLSLAKEHANLSCEACERYASMQTGEPDDMRSWKIIHFASQTALAHMLLLTGENDAAGDLIEKCLADEFVHYDSVKRSNASALASIRVMSVHAELLSRTVEPCIYRLLEAKRRVISVNFYTMPRLPQLGVTQEEASPTFGLRSEPSFTDTNMRVNLILESVRVHLRLAKAHIYNGDSQAARMCVIYGLHVTGRLHLKKWYLSFFLLKMQLASLEDEEEDFKQLCRRFAYSIRCDCDATPAHCMEFDAKKLLKLPKKEDDMVKEINAHLAIPREKIGSDDDGAIEISSQPIDVDSVHINTTPSASPMLRRRKSLDSHCLPDLFRHAAECECQSCSDAFLINLQLDFACLLSSHCARTCAVNQGLEICGSLSKVLRHRMGETASENGANVTHRLYLIKCLLMQANLFQLNQNLPQSLQSLNEAEDSLSTTKLVDLDVFRLRARMHFLFSQTYTVERDDGTRKSSPADFLNVLIDSICKCRISEEKSVTVSTPVMQRSSKMTRKVGSTVKGKATVVGPLRRGRNLKTRKPFLIFSDESDSEAKETNNLPKPEIIPDNEHATEKNVYDFSSDEDTVKGKKRSTAAKRDTQNLMVARKVATQRHRRKFGPVYTDQEQEKARGAQRKTTSGRTRRKKPNDVAAINPSTPIEGTPASPTHEKIAHLLKAMSLSNLAGDSRLTKLCSSALCLAHLHADTQTASNVTKATAHQLFSIGVSTRTAIHVYAKTNLQSSAEKEEKNRNNQSDRYKGWLEDVVSSSNPHSTMTRCIDESGKFILEFTESLDENWTVCAISLASINGCPKLAISRLRKGVPPFCVKVDGKPFEDMLERFSNLMECNSKAMKCRDKSSWWTNRRNFDDKLNEMIKSVGDEVIGCYQGALLGRLTDEHKAAEVEKNISLILAEFGIPAHQAPSVDIFLNSWHSLSAERKVEAVMYLCGNNVTTDRISSVASRLEGISADLKLALLPRCHVILILDKDVQRLPWESMAAFQKQSTTRMPSHDILKMQLALLRTAEKCVATKGVDMTDVSYVLNPSGDLVKTEERLKDWFQVMTSWKGIVSRPPMTAEWISSITMSDLFIYCGHGSGSKFVARDAFRKIKTRAAVLLMGCNSGKLEQNGIFEPTGVILDYLITGAPCVLGCLWAVTDKDIDKYLGVLLSDWGAGEKSLPQCAKVAQSSCKMQWINGSACVYYGLPVRCQRTITEFLENIPELFTA